MQSTSSWSAGWTPEELPLPGDRDGKIWGVQLQLERYKRRMITASSMERRARYGKKIRQLTARLVYLRMENS